MKIRLHKLVSLANIASDHTCCTVWHLCTALFSINTSSLYISPLFSVFTSLTSLCLPPALLQYRHLSPTWRSQRSLPPSLASSLYCFLASISLAAASHEARWVTATHSHRVILSSTIHAWTSRPICDSASADGSRGNLEKLSNVTPTHEWRNGEETRRRFLTGNYPVCAVHVTQRVIVRKNCRAYWRMN